MPRKPKETPEKHCAYCGEKLERKRFGGNRLEDFSAFTRRKYCNQECMGNGFLRIGHTTQNIDDAHSTSRHINKRILKSNRCAECGTDKDLQVHHIDGDYNNNTVENLIVLCRSCHMKRHRKKCVICGKPVRGHGYCDKHYQRFKKSGDPYFVKRKPPNYVP